MATNTKIGVGLASWTTASEMVRLELAFPFVEGVKCGAVTDGDLLALGNVLHSMYRFPSDAGVPRVVGIWYARVIDPGCVQANASARSHLEAIGFINVDNDAATRSLGAM